MNRCRASLSERLKHAVSRSTAEGSIDELEWWRSYMNPPPELEPDEEGGGVTNKKSQVPEPHLTFEESLEVIREILIRWWGFLRILNNDTVLSWTVTLGVFGSQILTIWFPHAWYMAIVAITLVSGKWIVQSIIAGRNRR